MSMVNKDRIRVPCDCCSCERNNALHIRKTCKLKVYTLNHNFNSQTGIQGLTCFHFYSKLRLLVLVRTASPIVLSC